MRSNRFFFYSSSSFASSFTPFALSPASLEAVVSAVGFAALDGVDQTFLSDDAYNVTIIDGLMT